VGGAAVGKMVAGLIEAEGAVHREADLACVGIFLAVVFPPADGAQRHGVRGFQRFVPAARAAKTSLHQEILHVTIDGGEGRGVYLFEKHRSSIRAKSERKHWFQYGTRDSCFGTATVLPTRSDFPGPTMLCPRLTSPAEEG